MLCSYIFNVVGRAEEPVLFPLDPDPTPPPSSEKDRSLLSFSEKIPPIKILDGEEGGGKNDWNLD